MRMIIEIIIGALLLIGGFAGGIVTDRLLPPKIINQNNYQTTYNDTKVNTETTSIQTAEQNQTTSIQMLSNLVIFSNSSVSGYTNRQTNHSEISNTVSITNKTSITNK